MIRFVESLPPEAAAEVVAFSDAALAGDEDAFRAHVAKFGWLVSGAGAIPGEAAGPVEAALRVLRLAQRREGRA